jgi:hypothetical protein
MRGRAWHRYELHNVCSINSRSRATAPTFSSATGRRPAAALFRWAMTRASSVRRGVSNAEITPGDVRTVARSNRERADSRRAAGLESRSAGIAGREDPKVHGVRWAERLPLRAIPAVRLPLDDIAIPPVCGVCGMHLYAILDDVSRFAMRVPPHRCRHYSTRRRARIRAESPNIARSACKVYSNIIPRNPQSGRVRGRPERGRAHCHRSHQCLHDGSREGQCIATDCNSMNASNLVQKLWNYCNVLRDDGRSHGDYVEQLTYLLFRTMVTSCSTTIAMRPKRSATRRAPSR